MAASQESIDLRFGLNERNLKTLVSVLESFPHIQRVVIFGSRAKGNFHAGSDIDLAIMNEEIGSAELSKLQSKFEESDLPFFVDLVNYSTIDVPALREHIDRVGVEFYLRKD